MGLFKVKNTTEAWIDTDIDSFYCIIIPLVSFFSFVLNVICFTIFNSSEFLNKVKLKQNLYRYLKFESLFISLNMFIQMFRPLQYSPSFQMGLISKIYDLYLVWFLAGVLEMFALNCHIISTLDFYMVITNRNICFPCLVQIPYVFKLLAMFVISFFLFAYLLFCYEINKYELFETNESNQTTSRVIYSIDKLYFEKTKLKSTIEIFAYLIRDGIMVLILIILNILIYLHVRKSLIKKKRMLLADRYTETTQSIKGSNIKKKLKNVNIKIIAMVILTTLNNVCGRVPMLIYFIVRNFSTSKLIDIFCKIGVISIFVSYTLSFFIFYFCNNRFRQIFQKKIAGIFFRRILLNRFIYNEI